VIVSKNTFLLGGCMFHLMSSDQTLLDPIAPLLPRVKWRANE